MLPLCRAEGIGVIPWSPLARGRLARPWEDAADAPSAARSDAFGKNLYSRTQDADRAVVERVQEIAEAARPAGRAGGARVAAAEARRHRADRRRHQAGASEGRGGRSLGEAVGRGDRRRWRSLMCRIRSLGSPEPRAAKRPHRCQPRASAARHPTRPRDATPLMIAGVAKSKLRRASPNRDHRQPGLLVSRSARHGSRHLHGSITCRTSFSRLCMRHINLVGWFVRISSSGFYYRGDAVNPGSQLLHGGSVLMRGRRRIACYRSDRRRGHRYGARPGSRSSLERCTLRRCCCSWSSCCAAGGVQAAPRC